MPPTALRRNAPKVLVIDIGGTNVKILATGQHPPRKFPSGKTLTPAMLVEGVKQLAHGWEYDVVSIGFPPGSSAGAPTAEPRNLAPAGSGSTSRRRSGAP